MGSVGCEQPSEPQGRFSAIIVNFNSGPHLAQCLRSLVECDNVTRIVVVDNGSSDDSLSGLPGDSRIHIIRNRKNLGFSCANNRGMAKAGDDPFLLFLNPDTIVSVGSLAAMLEFMMSHPDVGMCGPLITNPDGTEQRGCRRDEPRPFPALKTMLGLARRGINHVDRALPSKPIEVDAISGSCMLVRRTALEAVGPFDENYFLHCEDLDWCKRFWLAGWKVMFVPDAVITHAKGACSRGRRVRVEWHKHRGMARYYRKFQRQNHPIWVSALITGGIWTRFLLMAPWWYLRDRMP